LICFCASYRPDGRVQNLEQAKEVDNSYYNLIRENNIQFHEVESGDVKSIINLLKQRI
jgi:hypothetical protein